MSQDTFSAAYRRMAPETLSHRMASLREMMRSCHLCPRNCGVNRLAGETGVCCVAAEPIVSSHGPHFGEEAPLVGRHGSGTVFLTHCNLKCIFCQNYDISHLGDGKTTTTEKLADMFLDLQRRGCHNINWVTPTHQAPMLVEAARIARERGLTLPIVYNCGGYESLEALQLLEGIVDIYMPDAKYGDDAAGRQLSGVPDYWARNQEALAEMHRQVGDLMVGEEGIARRGLLVRHLVLPQGLAGTDTVMPFLASLSRNTYVNVMAQYRPAYRAGEVAAMARPPTSQEFRAALEAARGAGITRLDERSAAW